MSAYRKGTTYKAAGHDLITLLTQAKEIEMETIYNKLAKHLDNLPGGYPTTESGVELRILKRLFTAPEAELAITLSIKPETVAAIAERTDQESSTLSVSLEEMAKKGLIFRSYKDETVLYSAAMFVIGIWEYHVNDLDAELVKDVNEYLPHIMKDVWSETNTKHLRVIPISESISQDIKIASYEDAETLIKAQSKITVQPCICRKEHEVLGEPCKYPLDVCFAFGAAAYFYEENKLGRSVTIEEALEILEVGKKAGLVIQPGNAQRSANICMCCGCCCQMLKNLKNFESPAEEVHSNYFAKVTEDECIGCGECVERCHMDAITMDDRAQINLNRCIGCGICIPECPTEAIQLIAKEKSEKYVPAKFTFQAYMRMAKERGKI